MIFGKIYCINLGNKSMCYMLLHNIVCCILCTDKYLKICTWYAHRNTIIFIYNGSYYYYYYYYYYQSLTRSWNVFADISKD